MYIPQHTVGQSCKRRWLGVSGSEKEAHSVKGWWQKSRKEEKGRKGKAKSVFCWLASSRRLSDYCEKSSLPFLLYPLYAPHLLTLSNSPILFWLFCLSLLRGTREVYFFPPSPSTTPPQSNALPSKISYLFQCKLKLSNEKFLSHIIEQLCQSRKFKIGFSFHSSLV